MEHTVTVTQQADEAIIGNDYLTRVFSTKGKKLRTARFVNHRTGGLDTAFAPGEDSEEFLIAFTNGKLMKTSALTLQSVSAGTLDGGGQRLVFEFHMKHGWQISMTVEMRDGDPFMRKYLKLSANERAADKYKVDYIDLERMTLGKTVISHWSRPNGMEDGLIDGYHLSLGQPVYINGMYFGCEFPGTDNGIVGERAFLRYYSGKSFRELKKAEDGTFTTWPTVAGAARSVEYETVRSDFLDYIESIATPCSFRKQYNSWYDHMLDITADNMERSFYEIEKGLTQHGVEPLDAYVVDDGWADYSAEFWKFNQKFPDELYGVSGLARKFSSEFGLWLGPRGGYSQPLLFARQVEKAGNGALNTRGKELCVNHADYQKKLLALFLDYMDKFDIGYWKLDGFASKACRNKRHGHMVGGEHDMYYTTELWERWTELFSAMRAHRAAQGKGLWINFTTYAPPSPWFLQWVNTMWLQNCADIGFDEHPSAQVDQMLNYRDERYFDFLTAREFQYPLSHIYNHEPIYGNAVKINMTTGEFRTYLMMLACRGTAFWEMYFSYSRMDDEKWTVCAEVLHWAKKNFAVLKHARLIGKTPAEGNVYGYSSWSGDKGILALRNPTNVSQSYTVVLNRLIGVPEDMDGLYRTTVLPCAAQTDDCAYRCGDKITVDLGPYEALVWEFGEKDDTPPRLIACKTTGVSTIEASFDQRLLPDCKDFTVEGNEVTAISLQADYRTVTVTVREPLKEDAPIVLHAAPANTFGRHACETAELFFDNQGIITSVRSKSDLQDADALEESEDTAVAAPVLHLDRHSYPLKSSKGVCGILDFTLSLLFKTTGIGTVLTQKDAWSLYLDEAGHLCFEADGTTVRSSERVNDGTWKKVTAVREKNGMLKLYLSDSLDSSAYRAPARAFPQGRVTLGSAEFTGCVSLVYLKNSAASFDDLITLKEMEPESEADEKPSPRKAWFRKR